MGDLSSGRQRRGSCEEENLTEFTPNMVNIWIPKAIWEKRRFVSVGLPPSTKKNAEGEEKEDQVDTYDRDATLPGVAAKTKTGSRSDLPPGSGSESLGLNKLLNGLSSAATES